MLTGADLAAGLAVLLALLAAGAVAGHLAVRRLAPALDGAAYVLAVLSAATTAWIAAVVLPGAVGLLQPVPALVTALALAGAAAWRAPRAAWRLPAGTPWLPPGPAWLAVLAVAACALGYLRTIAGLPILSIDALNFNLTIPADWLRTDSVWGLHQFIPDYSNATYPHNGNALLALVMLPFESAFLAQLVAVPYWAAAGVAVVALAREVGAPAPAGVLAGCAFAAVPVALRAGLEGAQTDLPMLAAFGTGTLLLLRHHRTGERGVLALAGLSLGLAVGTKWYGLPTVAVVLLLWAAGRRSVRGWPLLLAPLLLAGGFWFLRNWVTTGNPVFPQGVPLLFEAPDDPIREAGGWTLAHYLVDGDVWRTYLWPAFRDAFGPAGAVLVAALAAATVVARDRRVRLLAVGSLLLVAVYWVTPYSAFGPEGRPVLASASTRYGLPALMGAAVVAGWLGGRGRAWGIAVPAALALGVLDGLRRFFDLGAADLAVGVVLAVAFAALVLVARRAPLAGAGAAAVALVVVTIAAADRANDRGYAAFDPAFAAIDRRGEVRVGIAGVWSTTGVPPALPAYGPRLRNDVSYVGHYPDGMLRRFTGERAFARAAESYDLLLVGTGIPPGTDDRAIRWAKAAGWREVTRSARLVLLER